MANPTWIYENAERRRRQLDSGDPTLSYDPDNPPSRDQVIKEERRRFEDRTESDPFFKKGSTADQLGREKARDQSIDKDGARITKANSGGAIGKNIRLLEAAGIPSSQAGTIGGDQAGLAQLRARQDALAARGDALMARGLGQEDQSRAGQLSLAQQLQAVSEGRGGPSVAESQLRQGMDAAVRSQQSIAASGRGNPALAARTAATNAAQIQQGTNAEASTLRAREIAEARGQLGTTYGQMRAGDQATTQLGANVRTKGEDNRLQLESAQATAAYNQEMSRQNLAIAERADKRAQQQQIMQGVGMGLNALGGAASAVMSDKRAKDDIKPADKQLYALLDSLDPKEYHYKDEPKSVAKHLGILAQDLEKEGPELVEEGDDGYKRVLGDPSTMYAALASLHDRLKNLEGGRDGRI